jgi:hypothetical protein
MLSSHGTMSGCASSSMIAEARVQLEQLLKRMGWLNDRYSTFIMPKGLNAHFKA